MPLKIVVPATQIGEEYDEVNNEFISIKTKEQVLTLEHSLVSLSKWEAKWHKPFLSITEKTMEEFTDYVRCMTLTQNVDPRVYQALTPLNRAAIDAYINTSQTATTIPKNRNKTVNRKIITSELIYYWMLSYNIPFECQKWHLSRLLTLINVCNVENGPKKKMSLQEIFSRNRAMNAARRKKYNTRG